MPELDPSVFQKRLTASGLAPLYVLYGEDSKRVDALVDAIEATIDPADRPFAVERLYAGDDGGEPVDIAAAARTLPMLGDRRVVIVLRAERLLKPKRAGKAVESDEGDEPGGDASTSDALDLAALEDYVDSPTASNTLVFVASDIDRTRRFTKRLLEKALVTHCGGFAGDRPGMSRDGRSEAMALAQHELLVAGRSAEPAALQLLIERSANDVTKLRGDLERLLLYTEGRPRITRDDVLEIATESSAEDPWAITNAVADGDAARALREVGERIDRGDSPHAIVGQLRWWVSARLVQSQPHRVQAAIQALLRTDLALKSSGGDGRVLVERLIVELTAAPVASNRRWGAGR